MTQPKPDAICVGRGTFHPNPEARPDPTFTDTVIPVDQIIGVTDGCWYNPKTGLGGPAARLHLKGGNVFQCRGRSVGEVKLLLGWREVARVDDFTKENSG